LLQLPYGLTLPVLIKKKKKKKANDEWSEREVLFVGVLEES